MASLEFILLLVFAGKTKVDVSSILFLSLFLTFDEKEGSFEPAFVLPPPSEKSAPFWLKKPFAVLEFSSIYQEHGRRKNPCLPLLVAYTVRTGSFPKWRNPKEYYQLPTLFSPPSFLAWELCPFLFMWEIFIRIFVPPGTSSSFTYFSLFLLPRLEVANFDFFCAQCTHYQFPPCCSNYFGIRIPPFVLSYKFSHHCWQGEVI